MSSKGRTAALNGLEIFQNETVKIKPELKAITQSILTDKLLPYGVD